MTAPSHDAPPEPSEPPTTSAQAQAVGARLARRVGLRRETIKDDALAGLTSAIGSVPDGMAAGILAGVNPIYGLYSSISGPIVGGIFTNTRLMVVTTTSAAALAAGNTLTGQTDNLPQALFLLTVLVGVLQIVAGLLRLGRFTRFVSHSVMVGFLTGVAVLIVLGQLPDLFGYAAEGDNKVSQTFDLIRNVGETNLRALLTGLSTLVLAVYLPRTRVGALGTLLALAIPSILVILLGWNQVSIVSDVADIPSALPLPELPHLSVFSLELFSGAVAIAIIVLVQGAGVSQSVPNQDGSPPLVSRDFRAQGIANVATGLFHGMPVGGSVGQTALNVSAGARTRWAPIMAGIWMIVIVGLLASLVSRVAMPSLAALLILAGYKTIDLLEGLSIWRTGWSPRIAIVTTFVATLFLPIQFAVGLGVALSALFYLNAAATDISIVELIRLPNGDIEERTPPKQLPSHAVTTLDVYGSLFYAGAYTLQRALPSSLGSERPVVVLRLRGRTRVGATFVEIIAGYAEQLRAAGGRLYLSGVDVHVHDQLARTSKVEVSGPVTIFDAAPVRRASTRQAQEVAEAWLIQHQPAATDAEKSPAE